MWPAPPAHRCRLCPALPRPHHSAYVRRCRHVRRRVVDGHHVVNVRPERKRVKGCRGVRRRRRRAPSARREGRRRIGSRRRRCGAEATVLQAEQRRRWRWRCRREERAPGAGGIGGEGDACGIIWAGGLVRKRRTRRRRQGIRAARTYRIGRLRDALGVRWARGALCVRWHGYTDRDHCDKWTRHNGFGHRAEKGSCRRAHVSLLRHRSHGRL